MVQGNLCFGALSLIVSDWKGAFKELLYQGKSSILSEFELTEII